MRKTQGLERDMVNEILPRSRARKLPRPFSSFAVAEHDYCGRRHYPFCAAVTGIPSPRLTKILGEVSQVKITRDEATYAT